MLTADYTSIGKTASSLSSLHYSQMSGKPWLLSRGSLSDDSFPFQGLSFLLYKNGEIKGHNLAKSFLAQSFVIY